MSILRALRYTFGRWADVLGHEHIIHANHKDLIDPLILKLLIGIDVRRDVSIARRSERARNANLKVYRKFKVAQP